MREQGNASGAYGAAAQGDRAGRFKSEFFEWGEALVISLTVIVLLFTFAVRLIGVDGSSMVPTLQDRDKVILLNNLLYHDPQKGDVVVLAKKSFQDGQPIVKRVIATGGDTVDIDFTAGEVFVNGEKLNEPYINEPTHEQLTMSFPQTVPEGCIFVMGDNRNKSTDSRDVSIGMVDTRYVLGHVLARVLPVKSIGAVS
ncbi:signal peptidase I [Intestinibacillus massiliensis]|uniref:signal peptidase I n=1 Tax=Intestinibacillus massiliensis TaxID=1871029 RepID=UPI001F3355C5|nr:signal peptidase I [Intestinibacillus massiliensis]